MASDLMNCYSGAVASAVDTICGAPRRARGGRTTRVWVRGIAERGITYSNRDGENGWYEFHIEECFHLGVARRLRDLGVPYDTITEVVEELEFGAKKRFWLTHGSVSVVVDQAEAMKEATLILMAANNRQYGTSYQLARPNRPAASQSVTLQ